ncbi:hypothetical protein HQ496_11215 [bacterium]|nr:hypothetical protein [bacterium]
MIPSMIKRGINGLFGMILLTVLVGASGWNSAITPNSSQPVSATSVAECTVGPFAPGYYAPDYYQVRLVGTRKVQGARQAKGMGSVTFATSPFGVALSETGTYVVDLDLEMSNVTLDPDMSLAAWVTTPQIDQIAPIGHFDSEFKLSGSTGWNKFLIVITLEPKGKPLGSTWTGPIVARGMSRSGLMHTMAGHGPFETEPCAVYGF